MTLPIIPTFNNGQIGPNTYVNAETSWVEALTGTERSRETIPRFAEYAKHFGCCLIRNGLWLSAPMAIDQASCVRAAAAANPDDADLAAQADVQSFIDGCGALTESGIDVLQYVGAPWRFERLPDETIPAWSWRLRQELEPQLTNCKGIVFDNTMGSNTLAHGEWKAVAVGYFLRQLQSEQPELRIFGEPCWWWHNRRWCDGFGSFLSADFFGNQLRRDPNAIDTWAARKPSGTFIGDPSPLMIPGITGSPVYIWLDFKSTPLFAGDPKKERIRYLEEMHERWPHAWLCAPFGWLPKELLD